MVRQKPMQKSNCVGIKNEQQDDIAQYFQKLKPPPPPENDNSWELQYCRWWGWNWVKKREECMHQEDCKKNQVTQSRTENKKTVTRTEHKNRYDREKVRKKHFKQLCNCLCFKKPKSVDPSLQELYKTPSNSVVLHETYMCGYTGRNGDSISHLEMRRNVSRTCKRGVCQSNFHQIVSEDDALEEEISSSCLECDDDTPGQYRSTEESSEYINVKCCCERGKVEPALIMKELQTQTSHKSLNKLVVKNVEPNLLCSCNFSKRKELQTQTSRKCLDKVIVKNVEPNLLCSCKLCCQKCVNTKKKNKRLHIICHCCCCKYNNIHSIEINGKSDENQGNNQFHGNQKQRPSKENDRVEPDQLPDISCRANKKFLIENVNFLDTMRPWDRILRGTKAFSKFGTPSKQYPWVHGTQSDVLDKCYSLKIDEEFSSPVSGKKYNLTPIKFDNLDEITTSTLPDPIEVEEDIKYLNHLEDQIKMDFKSRVMLDKICDAILFNSKNNDIRDKSSILLDEFTFSPQLHAADEHLLTEYSHQRKNLHAQEYPNAMQEFMYSEPDLRTSHQRIVKQVENLVRNLLLNDVKSSDINRHPDKKEIKVPFQNRNVSDANVNTAQSITISNINKRVASPVLSEQPKRVKCEKSSTDSLVQTVDNLIAKIDEITVKGQVNVEKIQNVFKQDSFNIFDRREKYFNENYNEHLENANPSEIFHKIDRIIKCSNDNNDKIGTVMQNTCPTLNHYDYISEADECQASILTEDDNEVEHGAGVSKCEELVNILPSLENEQQNTTKFDYDEAISEKETIDTNLVNIKKKKCFRSMIPVRGKKI